MIDGKKGVNDSKSAKISKAVGNKNRKSANITNDHDIVLPVTKSMTKNNNRKSSNQDRNDRERKKVSDTRYKNDSDIVTPITRNDRKSSMRDHRERDIVTPLNYKRGMMTTNYSRESTATPSFHRDFTRENTTTPSFSREKTSTPCFTRENTVTPSFHREIVTPLGYTRDIATPVTPRFEIKGLKLSGPALINLDKQSQKPQRPARNKNNRKSQSIDTPEPPQITPRLSRKSHSFDNSSSQQPPQIIPRTLPKLEVVQKPSIRKVDEIDDLVTKQVHNNAPVKKPAPPAPISESNKTEL